MGLSENSVLDVAIGMSFIFFVLAVFATAISEAIAAILQTRSKSLEGWLTDNLANPDATGEDAQKAKEIVAAFYRFPAVNGLTRNGRGKSKKPSYIPSEHAITALVGVGAGYIPDVQEADRVAKVSMDEIKDAIEKLPDSPIRGALLSAWNRAGGDVSVFRATAERWFDDAMDRLSGWYKRRLQLCLWVFGFLIACAVNADAFHMAQTLYKDPTVRQIVAAQAQSVKGATPDPGTAAHYIANLPLPLGWGKDAGGNAPPVASWAFLAKLFGLLLTSAAVAMGAPFWFDTLTRLGSLRGTGPQPNPAPAQPGVTIIHAGPHPSAGGTLAAPEAGVGGAAAGSVARSGSPHRGD